MSLARCLAFVAAGLAAGAAAAQPLQMRATEILGREVVDSNGERLAIRDLVIDPATGKVQYLAVGRPGSDRQEKLRLVPVSALRSVAGDGLVLVQPEEGSSAGASALAPALVE
jgi:sporulation protein YlmC with PRC-barrel domain